MGIPCKLDKGQTRRLAARFDEAMDIIANEFTALDTHQRYRNAFSRLLKWDPLGRVLMLGTDQRDLFVPELRQAIVGFVPKAGRYSISGAATVRPWRSRRMPFPSARDFHSRTRIPNTSIAIAGSSSQAVISRSVLLLSQDSRRWTRSRGVRRSTFPARGASI
jgi:hypothetical protein